MQGRLQNYSEIDLGRCQNEPNKASINIKLQRDWSEWCWNEAKRASITIKLQRNAGTAAKLQRNWSGARMKQKWTSIIIKLQWNARPGQGGCKLVGTMPG